MILSQNEQHQIIKPKAFESKSVELEESPEAIKILTEKLYSDIPLAVVRELCTNAIDANRESNVPLNNLIIHIPSIKEPFFSVEDFGVGMTKDEVFHVFTTFFKSTKADNNENTGMYGLGSKSPLAYTKSFTIISNLNGKSNVFMETWEDGKMPNIDLVSSKDIPNDLHGTKIIVPVKINDINDFRKSIIKTVMFFNDIPKFENLDDGNELIFDENKSLDIHELAELILEYNGTVVKNPALVKTWGIYVEMGNVGYPISLLDTFNNSDIKELFCKVLNKIIPGNLIIHAHIGDVDVLPSRESLQMTRKTVDYLQSWVLSYVSDKYEIISNINDRYTFYAKNQCWINQIDVIYKYKECLFESKQQKFLEFYRMYKDDLALLHNVFDDISILTHTPYNELGVNNKFVPYPYITSLYANYFIYSYKPLRVIEITKDIAKHLKPTKTGNISGSFIRNHIRNCSDYKKYNYLFTDKRTINKLDSYGIKYELINSFNEKIILSDDNWSNECLFELAYVDNEKSSPRIQGTLVSCNHITNAFLGKVKIIPLIKSNDGYSIVKLYTENANMVDRILVSRSFEYLARNIIETPEEIIISGSLKNILRLFNTLKCYEFIDFPNKVVSWVSNYLNDIKNLPVFEENNFCKLISSNNLVDYVNSYKWPDGSPFNSFKDTNHTYVDEFSSLNYKLNCLENSFYYRTFLRFQNDGFDDIIRLIKNLEEKVTNNQSCIDLNRYPLVRLNMIKDYSSSEGFYKQKDTDEIKALIDYFALHDGALRKKSTN